MNFLDAIILGIVEGLTEFLPISSTGHLILTAKLLDLPVTQFLTTFEVVIQLGAILAVVVLYFQKFLHDWEMNKRLLVGLIPALVVGGVFYPFIKSLFASPMTVVVSLIIGGIFIILIEYYQQKKEKTITDLSQISYRTAFFVGLFQALAVIPGVSRAGATIMGGLLLGMKRTVIVEFSFLLAVPTMLAASSKDLYESVGLLTSDDFGILAVGFVTSFVVALITIKFLIRFAQTHTFTPFGIYRIALGLLFLLFVL
jgi:undecaprenyl-diphosphatase